MGKLIIVSAPSGSGKTTLCSRLLRDFPQLELSISSTTRQPRGLEKDGKEYHFISKERFESGIKTGEFAEWALVHGNYYGTQKSVVKSIFSRGHSVLLDIDVQGAESLRKSFPESSFTVFVAPPDLATLEQRLRARGTDSGDTIVKRMKNAELEMAQAPLFDAQIINDDLDRAYAELKSLVSQQLLGKKLP